jgi:uncharacterized Fe-S radical SAM superfamily protein PflX
VESLFYIPQFSTELTVWLSSLTTGVPARNTKALLRVNAVAQKNTPQVIFNSHRYSSCESLLFLLKVGMICLMAYIDRHCTE